MPTTRFVLDGGDQVVDADRVVRDSQLYVAEPGEGRQWLWVGSWPRDCVSAVLRQLDGPGSRWFPEDVRTSAGLETPAAPASEAVARPDGPPTRTALHARLLRWSAVPGTVPPVWRAVDAVTTARG